MSAEIPAPGHYEVVYLFCPYPGCSWKMPYSWDEMENQRPDEYVAHYQRAHVQGIVS